VYWWAAMAQSMPVLIAADAFSAELRAPVVAAAIGRGLERAGVSPPPDLCPVAGGGRGTIEVLLPALGGVTGDGFALVEDGGTALVELAATPQETGRRVVGAVAAGVAVVVLCAGVSGRLDGVAVVEAIEDWGGPRGAALVVLCEPLARDGGMAGALAARYGATPVPGPAFVLEQLRFDTRMRAARAVVVGEACLDRATLRGRVAGEAAFRARQAGVPCHAVAAHNAIDRFDARILDVQAILEATSVTELEVAGERLAAFL
jgi:glycerate kinase